MKIPLEITFRNMAPSESIETNICQRIKKLEHFYRHITSCRVVIEIPHKHKHKGDIFHVKIDITVPQGEIVVNREPEHNQAHEDVYVTIRDAFDAVRRRLEDYARKQRGGVKTHHQAR